MVERQAKRQLEELEGECERLHGELQALTPAVEAAQAQAKVEIRVVLQPDAVTVLQQFLEALEALAEASEAYKAVVRQSYRLLGAGLLPMNLVDHTLASRITQAQKALAKLT